MIGVRRSKVEASPLRQSRSRFVTLPDLWGPSLTGAGPDIMRVYFPAENSIIYQLADYIPGCRLGRKRRRPDPQDRPFSHAQECVRTAGCNCRDPRIGPRELLNS